MAQSAEALRLENQEGARADKGFKHPHYDLGGFPYCRYENALPLFTDSGPSGLNPFWLRSDDGDPYSTINRALADRAIDWYRERVEYPSWSNRIPEYPCPDWMHQLAVDLTGGTEQSFAYVECDTGLLLEWLHDCVMDGHTLRSFVLAHLRKGEDPRELVRKTKVWRNRAGSPLDNPVAFFVKKARDLGEPFPKAPRGPAPTEPLTVVQRPDLSDAIPGWSPRAPDFDRLVFEPMADQFLGAQAGQELFVPWLDLFDQLGTSVPSLTGEAWLAKIRTSIDPVRAKAKAAKTTFRR